VSRADRERRPLPVAAGDRAAWCASAKRAQRAEARREPGRPRAKAAAGRRRRPCGMEGPMIFEKFFSALRARLNKLANLFWESDPIAAMRYEYDLAVEQLKEGRVGLEQYRGLVERVGRQVASNQRHVENLETQVKAYLKAGDRDTASRFALELQKARQELAKNQEQLAMHEGAYQNSLRKIQHANKKLVEVRDKIQRYDAELKMSAAEAEIAKLSEAFDVNVTTDFGEIERVIQDRIDTHRGAVRVAADLSEKGIAEIEAEEKMEKVMADEALTKFEQELGLRTPETAPVAESAKDLGPAVKS
jgi:phage shock protein A